VATSTGGIFNKLPGRVGDSSLIGCGTYANDHGGVSCTGQGEAIIRIVMAKTALDFLEEGADPRAAARQAIALLAQKTGGTAGLIMIDRRGKIGYARNTECMPVGFILSDGQVHLDS
jgi:beta-aspartyl-peptidase (threonine type)